MTSNPTNLNLGNFVSCELTFDDNCYLEGLLNIDDDVTEKYGMVKNKFYLTASHGNFNYTANVNETIKESSSQRVCRMNNSSKLFLINEHENVNCTKEIFDSNLGTNCECSNVYRPNWEYCGKENVVCNKTGLIRFGNNGIYKYQETSKEFVCDVTTFGSTGVSENYCWILRKNDPLHLKYNESLEISEQYITCDLINSSGSILSSKIFNPFTQFTCSNAGFGNLSTDINNCVCYYYIN